MDMTPKWELECMGTNCRHTQTLFPFFPKYRMVKIKGLMLTIFHSPAEKSADFAVPRAKHIPT